MSEQSLPLDILTLMDTIRKQAQQYTAAFANIEQEIAALAKQRDDMRREIEEFRSKADFILNQIQQSTNETLHTVDSRAKTVELIYNELDTINTLHNSLDKLRISLEARDAELAALLQSTKAIVTKQIDQGLEKSSVKLDTMMEKAQARIATFDQKLAALQDQQRRMFTILGDDVQALKDTQSRQELPLRNDISRMRTELELFKEEILAHSSHDGQTSREIGQTKQPAQPLSEEKVRNDLDIHRRKTEQVESHIQTVESKLNIALGVAIFGIALTIISVFSVIFRWLK
ncbi:MAG: hypothetical protein ACK5C0_03610 [Candidatus Kapaibacterium sp.]|jgi:chromosome segregation ATPase